MLPGVLFLLFFGGGGGGCLNQDVSPRYPTFELCGAEYGVPSGIHGACDVDGVHAKTRDWYEFRCDSSTPSAMPFSDTVVLYMPNTSAVYAVDAGTSRVVSLCFFFLAWLARN